MIKIEELTNEDCIYAMETGEFSDKILASASRVIIILTQSWCPDWWVQKRVFRDTEDTANLKVYYLEYDKKDFKSEFTGFKETVFQNGLIPYLRYYKEGTLDSESNYSGRRQIRKWLKS
ncbi:MAG: hypothetical protein PQJ58_05360 [Spirochaetales bacterium]|nr:hypothetical protein [Spirochaetales bacterium]